MINSHSALRKVKTFKDDTLQKGTSRARIETLYVGIRYIFDLVFKGIHKKGVLFFPKAKNLPFTAKTKQTKEIEVYFFSFLLHCYCVQVPKVNVKLVFLSNKALHAHMLLV